MSWGDITQAPMAIPSKQLSDEDYWRLADFRYALRRFLDFSAKAAADEGLTPAQHQALLVIRGCPAATATVGRLAERLCIRPNSAAELAQRLEAAGLISRETCTSDRRTVLLQPTREGEAKLEVLTRAHRNELRQIGPEITVLVRRLGREEEP